MPDRLTQAIRRLSLGLALSAASLVALPAAADSLQRGDFPTSQNVTIIGVKDGKLQYRTAAAGDREVPLDEIKSLQIDAVPQFGEGLKAFKDGQMRNAQRSFSDIWGGRDDWVKDFAGYYLLQVYDQRDQPVEAAQVYAALAASDADLFFLNKPPVASLGKADEAQKKRIADEVRAVFDKSKGERREKLEKYLRIIIGNAQIIPDKPGPGAGDDGNDSLKKIISESKVTMPAMVWRVLSRKDKPADKWAGLKLLAEGKNKEAVEAMKPWLSNPGDLPEKLFIYGRAQLALADATEDTQEKNNLYRDAGLTFMRIVVHFDRQGQTNKLVAPARLEVAYIHQQIGRADIYEKLKEQVRLVVAEKEDYPEYSKRYFAITGEDPPEDE